MKVGDLIKFKETGALATIINVVDTGDGWNDRWVELYIGDGTLDNTPSSSGFTGMSLAMAVRTAEVVNESR